MKTIYVRYNRHRLPPFQLETSIVGLNGAQSVVKRALTPAAKNHINTIRAGYELVRRSLKTERLVLPRLETCDDASISFQYIEGPSLDQVLFQAFRADDKQTFFRTIDDYAALLKDAFGFAEQPEISPRVREVFGAGDLSRLNPAGRWLPIAVVDAVFENIILRGAGAGLIDNEWIFAGALPLDFILFRSLFYFHKVKYSELGTESWVPFATLLARYQIQPEQAQKYFSMEENFQSYVYGPQRCYQYKQQYQKRRISIPSLEHTIEHQRAVVRKYHDEITRLRARLAERERVIAEMVNSIGWRLSQKIARGINGVCPPASRRRRVADRLLARLKKR